ncbi:MAG: GNAT family N-acetyltransferase [Jatrophihabitantaceae bacterium]
MTFVRPAPRAARRLVSTLGAPDRADLELLVAADPIVNAVVASRLAGYRSFDPVRFGGALLGARARAREPLSAAVFNGGNLLPIGGARAEWDALADGVAAEPQVCTSIVGRADAVAAMWSTLEPAWGPARAIRAEQPLLLITRDDGLQVRPEPRLRVMNPADLARYLPAAAAMFTEELGISPFAGRSGGTYRRRVESLLATGRAFGIVDGDGRMVFKADVGALTAATCQLQGVWVRPELRGRGVGTAALAAVVQHALRLAPSVSLYVNVFNAAARRTYAKLGMREIAKLTTVLF